MIEIAWLLSLNASGGRFTVPDGTSSDEIQKIVDENIKKSVEWRWGPYPSAPKDAQ